MPSGNSRQHIGQKLLDWYKIHGRDLPFRKTKNPYHIWICEIVFQQTRIEQGLAHYENFIAKFPDIRALANAETDEVLLAWKGLGYYSRAINVQKAARQIMEDFGGIFPEKYEDILSLKGVGKYTAAAVSSICFGAKLPAVDGNFYRVLSRFFADNFDISAHNAFQYFSELAQMLMPTGDFGGFNQAMMDLGSSVCTPKNPKCTICPLHSDCAAFLTGRITDFPFKSKKIVQEDMALRYFFVHCDGDFLIKRRGEDFIWKNLYEFPDAVPDEFLALISKEKVVRNKLTHKNLTITISEISLEKDSFEDFAIKERFLIVNHQESLEKSFPKPLQDYVETFHRGGQMQLF